jgi:hypothetical protein
MRGQTRKRMMIIAAVTLVLTSMLGVPVSAQTSASFGANQEIARQLASVSTPSAPFMFSVYPEGGNGEIGYVAGNRDATVLAALNDLRGDRSFNVHLFTAWSWYNQQDLDEKIARYSAEGFYITLSIKYSPPAGREGDVTGYARFVRTVVQRYATNPNVHRFVIGNEANVTWGNPGSSDGPFARSAEAVARGVISARRTVQRLDSDAGVGFNIAITERETDAAFVRKLVDIGGQRFVQSLSFMGVNVYPGLWPVGSGDAYADMVTYIGDARYALTSAGIESNVSLSILENGFPTANDTAQSSQLAQMVQAVCDARAQYGVSGYSWFGLLDADSSSDNPYAHYGLLRSDLSARPSFETYRALIENTCTE